MNTATGIRKTIRPKGERTCDDNAFGVRAIAGFSFAKMFHHLFWDSTLVLAGEGRDGGDLRFSAKDKWMEVNQLATLGISQNDGGEFLEHVKGCASTQCIEAKRHFDLVFELLKSGRLPGGEAFAILAAIERSVRRDIRVSRKNGFGDGIDQIKPFIFAILDHPDDWTSVS